MLLTSNLKSLDLKKRGFSLTQLSVSVRFSALSCPPHIRVLHNSNLQEVASICDPKVLQIQLHSSQPLLLAADRSSVRRWALEPSLDLQDQLLLENPVLAKDWVLSSLLDRLLLFSALDFQLKTQISLRLGPASFLLPASLSESIYLYSKHEQAICWHSSRPPYEFKCGEQVLSLHRIQHPVGAFLLAAFTTSSLRLFTYALKPLLKLPVQGVKWACTDPSELVLALLSSDSKVTLFQFKDQLFTSEALTIEEEKRKQFVLQKVSSLGKKVLEEEDIIMSLLVVGDQTSKRLFRDSSSKLDLDEEGKQRLFLLLVRNEKLYFYRFDSGIEARALTLPFKPEPEGYPKFKQKGEEPTLRLQQQQLRTAKQELMRKLDLRLECLFEKGQEEIEALLVEREALLERKVEQRLQGLGAWCGHMLKEQIPKPAIQLRLCSSKPLEAEAERLGTEVSKAASSTRQSRVVEDYLRLRFERSANLVNLVEASLAGKQALQTALIGTASQANSLREGFERLKLLAVSKRESLSRFNALTAQCSQREDLRRAVRTMISEAEQNHDEMIRRQRALRRN